MITTTTTTPTTIPLTLVARIETLVLGRRPTEGERGGQEMSLTTTEILVLRPCREAVTTEGDIAASRDSPMDLCR